MVANAQVVNWSVEIKLLRTARSSDQPTISNKKPLHEKSSIKNLLMKILSLSGITLCTGEIFFVENEWRTEGWSSLIQWKINAETSKGMCFLTEKVDLTGI